jgi:hypothetical protein
MPGIVEMGLGRHLKRKAGKAVRVEIDLGNLLPALILIVALVVL